MAKSKPQSSGKGNGSGEGEQSSQGDDSPQKFDSSSTSSTPSSEMSSSSSEMSQSSNSDVAVPGQSSLLGMLYSNSIANSNLSQQNALVEQQSMNQVFMAITGKIVNRITELSPMEATAVNRVEPPKDDVSQQLAVMGQVILELKKQVDSLTTAQSNQDESS
ncbi:MAG: hypothetical protein AAGD25_20330 [Cyanobacteria bacterium P01_F01_bin.150]